MILDFCFWSQVGVSQHQNVSDMMSSWTSQKGFPLVTVSRVGDQVTFTQEHFLLTSDNATHTSRWVTQAHTQTHAGKIEISVTITALFTLFSLWNIPVTYVNDSCSLAPECRQMFTLKTKTGKTQSINTLSEK